MRGSLVLAVSERTSGGSVRRDDGPFEWRIVGVSVPRIQYQYQVRNRPIYLTPWLPTHESVGMDKEYQLSALRVRHSVMKAELSEEERAEHDEFQEVERRLAELRADLAEAPAPT